MNYFAVLFLACVTFFNTTNPGWAAFVMFPTNLIIRMNFKFNQFLSGPPVGGPLSLWVWDNETRRCPKTRRCFCFFDAVRSASWQTLTGQSFPKPVSVARPDSVLVPRLGGICNAAHELCYIT